MSYQPNLSLHVSDTNLPDPTDKIGGKVSSCGCGADWWKVLLLLLFLILLAYYYKVY